MRQQLVDLRAAMAKHGVDYCLVPSNDFHGSEYLSSHFKARKWVSGFTGSAGTLLVSADWAGLWTDGRYFLQAADQLEGSGIDLMKMGEPGVPTLNAYLEQHLQKGQVLAFDGRVVSTRQAENLGKLVIQMRDGEEITVTGTEYLVSMIAAALNERLLADGDRANIETVLSEMASYVKTGTAPTLTGLTIGGLTIRSDGTLEGAKFT